MKKMQGSTNLNILSLIISNEFKKFPLNLLSNTNNILCYTEYIVS